MSLRDRVPVEPLAPERWGHLEQRIIAHAGDALDQPARRRVWPMLAALGVAGAVAAAAFALRPAPARAPAPLVVTADARGAHVELGDAVIDAEPGTRFQVTRPDGGVRVELAAGAVALEVAPRRDRPPLWVIAGDVSVRVVGTAFTVRRDPEVSVTVSHGVVEVDRAGAAVAVRAGERWTASGVVALVSVDPALRVDPAAAGGAIAARAADDDALALSATPAVDPLARRRVAVVPTTTARSADGTDATDGTARPATPRPTPPRPAPAPAAPPGDLRAAIAAQSIPPAPPSAASSPADAIAVFQRELAGARGAAASSALWGLARSQWAAGKHADSQKSLDLYLRRFTSGAEADAVRWLRLRLLCARQFDDTCRAAAHTYATSAPDGPRRDLAVRATNTR